MTTASHNPTDNSQIPATKEQWTGTNLAGDTVENGIRKQKAEYQSDLRWFYRWSVETGKSQAESAEMLGVNSGTYSKVMRGEYKNANKLLINPPAVMMSRIRELRANEKRRTLTVVDRIMTPTVAEVHAVCRKTWSDGQLAFIFGESHIGKTFAALWFRDENNHGATIYVDLQGCAGEQDVWRCFARALHISADTPINKLRPRVLNAINLTNLVLVDEFHFITYGYQKAGAKRMINALKAIKDKTRCAMVIFSTNVAREEFTEGQGREAKLLKQLWRRGVIKLQLPDALRVGDVRAIVEAYDLPFPAAPKRAAQDKWKNLHVSDPDFEGLSVCENIAYNYGILHLTTVIKDGKKLAAKKNREIEWSDVIRAQQTYDAWAEPKTA